MESSIRLGRLVGGVYLCLREKIKDVILVDTKYIPQQCDLWCAPFDLVLDSNKSYNLLLVREGEYLNWNEIFGCIY